MKALGTYQTRVGDAAGDLAAREPGRAEVCDATNTDLEAKLEKRLVPSVTSKMTPAARYSSPLAFGRCIALCFQQGHNDKLGIWNSSWNI